MATHEVTIHPFPAQGRTPLTITSEEISRYAELTSLIADLEKQQKALRSELLELHKEAGAEQEDTGPYLLAFVGQQRHQIDWQSEAMSLAAAVYLDGLTAWKVRLEQTAPVLSIKQIRVKPNAAFAAGLTKRIPLTPGTNDGVVRFGG